MGEKDREKPIKDAHTIMGQIYQGLTKVDIQGSIPWLVYSDKSA